MFKDIFDVLNLAKLKAPIGLALAILVLFSLLFSIPSIKKNTQIWDEKLRQYLWYLSETEQRDGNLSIAVLDLYTSETFNASPDLYSQRYASYELPKSLDIFCKLGTSTIAFDFFIDDTTWLGRHLIASKQDSEALQQSLSCFDAVWVPIREEGGEWVFPIETLSKLDSVKYAHVNTYDSVLYSPEISHSSEKGQLKVPYMAVALAQTEADRSNYSPILPSISLNSFPRIRFEDLAVLKPLSENLPDQAIKNFYLRYFENADGSYRLPDTLLIGFSHDAQDQHNVSYNKGGPINLPSIAPNNRAAVGLNNAGIREVTFGTEPAVAFTPGVYVLASTAQSLANEKTPIYLESTNFTLLFVVMICLVIVYLISLRVNQGWQIGLTFLFSMFSYIYLVFFALSELLVLLPIIFPLCLLAFMWGVVEIRHGSGILHQITELVASRSSHSIENRGDNAKPIIINMAESVRDSHVDTYKHLVSAIDVLTYWIQLLALLRLAEVLENNSKSDSEIPKNVWKNLKTPTLGSYVYLLTGLNKLNKNIAQATANSRFPELFNLLKKHSKSQLEDLLHRIIQIRNDWKHFSSTAYSEAQLAAALDEVYDIDLSLNESLAFIDSFALIKTKNYKGKEGGKYYWDCLVYSGSATYIEEFATVDILEPERLYLFDLRKWGGNHNTLLLEPWIFAGECGHHRREEIFFYSGLKKDDDSHRITDKVKYAGLTESCFPETEISLKHALIRNIKTKS